MKKHIFLFLAFCLVSSLSFGQKQAKSSPKSEIPDEVRGISTNFANGLRYFYTGDYKNAEKYFLIVIDKDAKHAVAPYMMGRAKREQNDFAAAEHFLQLAIKNDKNNVWYLSELAEVQELAGNYNAAVQTWKKACKIEPRNEQFLISLTDDYLQLNDVKSMLSTIDKLQELVGPSDELIAYKVQIHLFINDVKGAIGEYDRLIKEYPTNIDYYISAAEICTNNNLIDKGIEYLEKAKRINPDNGKVLMVEGAERWEKKDTDGALKCWNSAFKSPDVLLEPKLSVMREVLSVHKANDVSPQALQLAKTLCEVHSDAYEGWAAVASLLFMQDKYVEAVPYFEQALQIDPSQYSLWQDFLYCLGKGKMYQKIIDIEDDLVEFFPTNGMVNYTLGDAHLHLNNPQKAIKYLEKSVKYTYDKNEIKLIYKTLATAYEAIGDTAKAQECRKKSEK